MKKHLLICTVALSLFLPSLSIAQKVITFETHSTNSRKKNEARGNNSISVGIGSFLNGYTPFYYDRKVTSFLSLAVGAGVTYRSYMNDFGMLVWNDGKSSEYFTTQDIEDDYASYKYRKATTGLYASFAPKIYFSDNAMDGFYLSPMIEMKQHKFTARMADVSADLGSSYYGYSTDADLPRSTTVVSEHMNCYDATINAGGHYQLPNHLVVGWNIGFGLRYAQSQRLDVGVVRDGNGASHYHNFLREYSSSKPLFAFNFILGGWF